MELPVLITRVKVGLARGMVLVSLESPAGAVSNGEVKNVETTRVAMSAATFAEVTELFAGTLKRLHEMEASPNETHGRGDGREHGFALHGHSKH